ncbi:MAG: aminopeptidase P family protein [Oscillospiraceae bacterium]|nr:aminopeptidase P family protein [Oscillospiraceae bacterium]
MSRFHKIAEKLDTYGLDAMMITSVPNRLYAAQFPSSAGVAIVTSGKSYFFTDSRYIEAAGKRITGAEIRQNTNEVSMVDLTNEVIQAHGIKKLGFEEQYATVAEYNRWKEKLVCQELVPATKLLMELRSVKEPEEIDCMIAAQRIAEKALKEVLEFIKPGVTEKEISAFLQYRMLCNGAEKMSFQPIVVSGVNSSMPHGVPSEKKVEEGDFITMDFGCVYGGYCSDMTRTVAVGYATEEMEKVYHTVLAAQKAGIAIAKAGVTGKAIHEAAAKVISDAGYGEYFGHGFGHSLGVEIHEDPRAALTNDKPLPIGAVISAEPGIYIPGKFGVRIEDVIVIHEDGCTDIMEAPHELIVLK